MLHLLQKSTELGMVGSQCLGEENVNPLLLVFRVQQTSVRQRVPPSYYAELNPSSSATRKVRYGYMGRYCPATQISNRVSISFFDDLPSRGTIELNSCRIVDI